MGTHSLSVFTLPTHYSITPELLLTPTEYTHTYTHTHTHMHTHTHTHTHTSREHSQCVEELDEGATLWIGLCCPSLVQCEAESSWSSESSLALHTHIMHCSLQLHPGSVHHLRLRDSQHRPLHSTPYIVHTCMCM